MRPFNLEDEGKKWLAGKLRANGFEVLDTDAESLYCHYDLDVVKNGKHTFIELKNRDCRSDDYNDIEIELNKWKWLRETEERTLLVYFWIDAWTIIDIKALEPDEKISHMARDSHKWSKGEMKMKSFVRWNINENITLYEYE